MIDHLRVPFTFDRRQRTLHGEQSAKQIRKASHCLLIVVSVDQVSPRQFDVPILLPADRLHIDQVNVLASGWISGTIESGKDQQRHDQLDKHHVTIESFGCQLTMARRRRAIGDLHRLEKGRVGEELRRLSEEAAAEAGDG